MLVIRLLRTGKKNQPSFKVVVVEKQKSSTSGRYIEEVGFYNPLTKERVLKAERIKYWISVGAQPSETIHNMLISEKIIEGKKIDLHKKSKKKEKATEVPVKEVAPEAAKAEEARETSPEVAKTEEAKETSPEAVKKEEVKEETPAEEVKPEQLEEKKE